MQTFVEVITKEVEEKFGEFLNRRQVRELVELFVERAFPYFYQAHCVGFRDSFLESAEKTEVPYKKTVFLEMSSYFDQLAQENLEENPALQIKGGHEQRA